MGKKFTLEFVKQYFLEHNCECLADKYIGSGILMPYICECGNESKIRFSDFNRGHRCTKCGGTGKHTLEYVQKYMEERNCICLATVYEHANALMPYICKCGNESKIRFGDFQQGLRCADCGGSKKHTLEYVQNYMEKYSCKCLAIEYKNNKTKLPYLCSCGHISAITFNDFARGRRCAKCKKSKGERDIIEYLESEQIPYVVEHKIAGCVNRRMLRFDFLIKDKLLVEFNGKQHYNPLAFGSKSPEAANINFEYILCNDKIKKEYCEDNNIPLLIIPYWQKDKISDLLQDFISNYS